MNYLEELTGTQEGIHPTTTTESSAQPGTSVADVWSSWGLNSKASGTIGVVGGIKKDILEN